MTANVISPPTVPPAGSDSCELLTQDLPATGPDAQKSSRLDRTPPPSCATSSARSGKGGLSGPRTDCAMSVHLPWPPSVNKIWRMATINGAPRMLLSAEGRKYREAVLTTALACYGSVRPLEGRLRVHLLACPPDRRRRDLDNVAKAILDALTHAGVWNDDEQIDVLRIERQAVGTFIGGAVTVHIEEIA